MAPETIDAPPEPGGGGIGDLFQRRYGPLPGWAWIGIAALGAGGILWLRRRNAKGAPAADSTDEVASDQGVSSGVAASDIAGYGASFGVLQTEIEQLQGTVAQQQHPATTPTTTAATTPATAPTTTPTTTPPKPAPQKYITVVVQKYTTKNPPWQSYLSGIASHYGTTVQRLAQINGIKGPSYIIHPGQQIKVPVK